MKKVLILALSLMFITQLSFAGFFMPDVASTIRAESLYENAMDKAYEIYGSRIPSRVGRKIIADYEYAECPCKYFFEKVKKSTVCTIISTFFKCFATIATFESTY
jgi:hypothetical protein